MFLISKEIFGGTKNYTSCHCPIKRTNGGGGEKEKRLESKLDSKRLRLYVVFVEQRRLEKTDIDYQPLAQLMNDANLYGIIRQNLNRSAKTMTESIEKWKRL